MKKFNSIGQVFIYLSGVAGIVYGAWLIYRPLGFVVGGVFCVALALMLNKDSDSSE